MADVETPKPVIIPIASGKGGVGKSFLAANLALALARTGHRTIAADLDLGGSNLHSFLGLPNRNPGIGDFIYGAAPALQALLIATDTPNLRFLPGDGRTPFLANLPSLQKRKLIRCIRSLPAEYVVLDIGAGASFTTLDLFACADSGLVVTTPELPAIMGMQVFLKQHLLRRIDRNLAVNGLRPSRPLLKELLQQPMARQLPSLKSLESCLGRHNPGAAAAVADAISSFRPRVVFNMALRQEESRLAFRIQESLADVLAIEPEFFGFIFRDAAVGDSVALRKPFLSTYPESPAAGNILKIAERIVKYWSAQVPDSATLMIKHVHQSCKDVKQADTASPGFAQIGRSGADGMPGRPHVLCQAWKNWVRRRLSYRAMPTAVERFSERA